MEYTMKLIFSKKADMNIIFDEIETICKENGTVLLEKTENSVIYGAESHDNFGPALVDLHYSDNIRTNLIGAYCTDPFDGTYSCRNDIIKEWK